jgi:hypothetical protein
VRSGIGGLTLFLESDVFTAGKVVDDNKVVWDDELLKNDEDTKGDGFALVTQAALSSPRACQAAAHEVFNQMLLFAELVAGGGRVLLDVNQKIERGEMLAYEDDSMPPRELDLNAKHLKLDEMAGIIVGRSVLSLELEAADRDQVVK